MPIVGFVRHASYVDGGQNGGQVSSEGQDESAYLAESLDFSFGSIDRKKVTIISSPAGRAIGTAKILAKLLSHRKVETFDCLWTDPEHETNMAEIRKVVFKKLKHDGVLLVVSHTEIVNELTESILREKEFGVASGIFRGLKTAECALLDLDSKSFQVVV